MRLTVLELQRMDLQGKENPPGATDEEIPEKGGKLRELVGLIGVSYPKQRG